MKLASEVVSGFTAPMPEKKPPKIFSAFSATAKLRRHGIDQSQARPGGLNRIPEANKDVIELLTISLPSIWKNGPRFSLGLV